MLDTQSDVSPSDVCKLETLILSWHFIIIFRVWSVLQGTLNPGPLHAVQQPAVIWELAHNWRQRRTSRPQQQFSCTKTTTSTQHKNSVIASTRVYTW
jgi:hypothetical protein